MRRYFVGHRFIEQEMPIWGVCDNKIYHQNGLRPKPGVNGDHHLQFCWHTEHQESTEVSHVESCSLDRCFSENVLCDVHCRWRPNRSRNSSDCFYIFYAMWLRRKTTNSWVWFLATPPNGNSSGKWETIPHTPSWYPHMDSRPTIPNVSFFICKSWFGKRTNMLKMMINHG